jgi:BolA family transcriptional regulator, general stress-responsive regulator
MTSSRLDKGFFTFVALPNGEPVLPSPGNAPFYVCRIAGRRTGTPFAWQCSVYLPTALTRVPPLLKSGSMRTADLITKKLTEAFAPQSLQVVDESHQHEGHAGHRPGGQTHFRIYIVSELFKNMTRLQRHRLINQTLSGELEGGVHALAIHAAAPGEGGI